MAHHSHGGSLLSTIGSNGLDPKLDALRRGLIAKDDTERVTRDLSEALARSVATISRSNSREGSPVKSRSREPSPQQEHGHVRGGGSATASTLAAYGKEGVNGDCINTSHNDPEMERSESVVRSLQEQAKRRLNGLERLHASAESKDSGPTLYNPASYQVSLRKRFSCALAHLSSLRLHTYCQPRGAALSTKVNNLQGLSRPKSAPKTASKTAVKKSSKKSPPLAIWRHELEMLESDLNLLASHQDQLHRERQKKMQAWEANLR